jgi:hypothetical protein
VKAAVLAGIAAVVLAGCSSHRGVVSTSRLLARSIPRARDFGPGFHRVFYVGRLPHCRSPATRCVVASFQGGVREGATASLTVYRTAAQAQQALRESPYARAVARTRHRRQRMRGVMTDMTSRMTPSAVRQIDGVRVWGTAVVLRVHVPPGAPAWARFGVPPIDYVTFRTGRVLWLMQFAGRARVLERAALSRILRRARAAGTG